MDFFNLNSQPFKKDADKSEQVDSQPIHVAKRPIETEEDFLNELIDEELLPNEIKYKPDVQHNITRDEFVEMQLKNVQHGSKPNNQIDLQNKLAKKKKEEELAREDLNMLQEYILTGQIIQQTKILHTTWYMHVLSLQESRAAIQRSEEYNEDSQQLAQALFVLSYAVERIDNYYFHSFDETRRFLEKLPLVVIYKAVNKYNEMFTRQEDIMLEPQRIRSLISDDFLRIKYQVMRNSGLVPADDRVRKMNDAQWLWYYYNMDEDMEQQTDIRQSELDYLGVFINPKMAQEMIRVNEQNRKKRKLEKEKAFKKYKRKVSKKKKQLIEQVVKQHQPTSSEQANSFLDELIKQDSQATQDSHVTQDVQELAPNESDVEQLASEENIFKNESNIDDWFKGSTDNPSNNNLSNNNLADHNLSDHNSSNNLSNDNPADSISSSDLADSSISNEDDEDYDESILDEAFGSVSTSHTAGNTTVNDNFERELRAALGIKDNESIDEQFTELADEQGAGNPYESDEDFYERVRAFLPFAGTQYGYVKPQKVQINRVHKPSEESINKEFTPERVRQGKALIKDFGQAPLSNETNKILNPGFMSSISPAKNIDVPKWKQESDREFSRRTGISSLESLNNIPIDKEKEIKNLTDNMDFFEVDE